MGYTTEFKGQFNLNKQLDPETKDFLTRLAHTRRMKRNVDPKYGVEGEFYAENMENFGQNDNSNIIDINRPPSTQPGLWLQWIPTENGLHIVWDGGEKFYHYIEWLQYLVDKILEPRGYRLSGKVQWQGESIDDFGVIYAYENLILSSNSEEYSTIKTFANKHKTDIKSFLKNEKNLPPLMGLSKETDRWISTRLKEKK